MVWNMVDVEMNVERGPVDGEWRCSWLLSGWRWSSGLKEMAVEMKEWPVEMVCTMVGKMEPG